MNKSQTFPVRLPSHALFLGRPAVALAFDLPCDDDELWLPLVADGKHEKGRGDVLGFLHLKKALTLQAGLTTYAVAGMRPAHDLPPNQATYSSLFQWPSLETCVELTQARSALLG